MSEEYVKGIIGDGIVTEIMLTAIAKQIGNEISKIYVACENYENRFKFLEKFNVKAVTNPDEFLSKVKILIFTWQIDEDFEKKFVGVNEKIPKDTLIIAGGHGLKISLLEKYFPGHAVIRTISNPMVAIGEGMSIYTTGKIFSEDSSSLAETILSNFGKVIKVSSENELEIAGKLISAGSIYFIQMVNSLIKSGITQGLSVEKSKEISCQLEEGTLKIISELENDEVIKEMTEQIGRNEKFFEFTRNIIESYGVKQNFEKYFQANNVEQLFKF